MRRRSHRAAFSATFFATAVFLLCITDAFPLDSLPPSFATNPLSPTSVGRARAAPDGRCAAARGRPCRAARRARCSDCPGSHACWRIARAAAACGTRSRSSGRVARARGRSAAALPWCAPHRRPGRSSACRRCACCCTCRRGARRSRRAQGGGGAQEGGRARDARPHPHPQAGGARGARRRRARFADRRARRGCCSGACCCCCCCCTCCAARPRAAAGCPRRACAARPCAARPCSPCGARGACGSVNRGPHSPGPGGGGEPYGPGR